MFVKRLNCITVLHSVNSAELFFISFVKYSTMDCNLITPVSQKQILRQFDYIFSKNFKQNMRLKIKVYAIENTYIESIFCLRDFSAFKKLKRLMLSKH